MPANLENSAVAAWLEKVSFHSTPKGNVKDCSDYHTIALISHASKVTLKILQAKLQQYMNRELPDVQAELRKDREKRSNCQLCWNIEKAREFQNNVYFHFIDYVKAFDLDHNKNGKFLKGWEYQTISPASWEICMQVRKQQLELEHFQ